MNKDKMKWSERGDEEEKSFRSRVGGKWREVTEVGCWADSLRNSYLVFVFFIRHENLACSLPVHKGKSLGISTLR